MAKTKGQNRSRRFNVIVSVAVTVAALVYFSSTAGRRESSLPRDARPGISPIHQAAVGDDQASHLPNPPRGSVGNPSGDVAAHTVPSNATLQGIPSVPTGVGELPPDLAAQANAPMAELPADLQRQLNSPPPELPPDLKAQLAAPPPELPEDMKRALRTPPRVVSIDEVNNPSRQTN